MDKYTGQRLSTIGEALAHELNICPPHVCGSCYRWVLALKMEEEVETRKHALRNKLATAMTDRHASRVLALVDGRKNTTSASCNVSRPSRAQV